MEQHWQKLVLKNDDIFKYAALLAFIPNST
jgi:hypothetical protein